MTGRVVSTKSIRTVTVLVERLSRHPLYKKDFIASKKYLVDDLLGVNVGDVVEFVKCKPISKRKHWMITKVVGKDVVALGKEALKVEASEAIAQVLPEEKNSEELGKTQKNSEKPKKRNSGVLSNSEENKTNGGDKN